jgi:chromosome segregation ATPase
MNKKRKCAPSEWSWTSKLYNASSLAKTATEQSEHVEILEQRLVRANEDIRSKTEECEKLQSAIKDWAAHCKTQDGDLQRSRKLTASLLANVEALKASMTAKSDEMDTLRQNSDVLICSQTEKIDSLNRKQLQTDVRCTTLTAEVGSKSAQILACKNELHNAKKELHNAKRECVDSRARKKIWRKKYEELAQMGATALAKITNESYGVSPGQFEAYKKIASTQFEVDKAQHERSEALKMLHANANALEDKH